MAATVKAITLRATYESNLEGFKADAAAIRSFRKQLEKTPIKVPVRLDLSGIRADAVRAAAEYKKALGAALANVPAGGTVSKGGIIIPSGAMKEMKALADTSQGVFKQVTNDAGKVLQTFEQLEAGVQRVTNFGKKGRTARILDERPLEQFRQRLAQIERDFGGKIGTARGTGGDVAGLLRQKQQAIVEALNDPKLTQGIKDTPLYQRADKSLDRLQERINALTGTQEAKAASKQRGTRIDALKQSLLEIDKLTAGSLGKAQGTRGDVARVLADKRQRIADEIAKYSDIADSPAYRSAQKAVATLDKQIERAVPQQERASDKKTRDGRIEELRDKLLGIDTDTARKIGAAKGNKGDVAAALANKRDRIARELANYGDIANSPAFKQAQRAINTLEKQIAQAEPTQQRRSEAERKQDFNRRTGRFIERQDDRVNRNLEKNLKEQESLAKRIPDQIRRERELNRVMDERVRVLRQQADQYRVLAQRAKDRGFDEASNRYLNAARRMEGQAKQVGLDRTRMETDRVNQASDQALKRRLDQLLNYEKTQRQVAKNDEKMARNLKNTAARDAEITAIRQRRDRERQQNLRQIQQVETEATRRGNTGLANRAYGARETITRQGVAEMGALASATKKSGHAIDFHTGSLLKNAATFTRWYIPAQAAMGVFAAFGRGMRGAIEAERTFKILNAVFRGTRAEAEQLADDTLKLAAANGRSAQEAAEAAVAWARMGLTRNQVLIAMEASLRAANVAEVDAAQATAYLTANYKAFNQTISEIPATLDLINSLSNMNPVAPKEIFEGLARSAATAKVAGFEFEKLAALITTVTATTQRPGQEVGNSINTVLTRLRRPRTVEALQEEFQIDIKTPEGDAKKAKEILAELAELYPKLNRLEKARLSDIVAGARQGNRFAIIMESWTDSLIAQAKAQADTNSAMRENAQILDSTSAKLEALSTSWTRLFKTMGDSGLFDLAKAGLEAIGFQIENATSGIKDMGDSLARLSGAQGPGEKGAIGKFYSQYSRYRKAGLGYGLSLFGTTRDAVSGRLPDEPEPLRDRLGSTRLGALVKETNEAQNRVKALAAAEEALRTMANSLEGTVAERRKVLSQFDELVDVFAELPGGEANVAKARLEIRPLLQGENVADGQKALRDQAEGIRDFNDKEFQRAEEVRQKALKETADAVDKTRAELVKLDQATVGSKSAERQKALREEYRKTDDILKEQQDILKRLQEQFDQPVPDWFAEHQQSLDAYLKDLTLIGEAYGKLLTTLGSTGFTNLDATLKIGASRIERSEMERMLGATRRDNSMMDQLDESELMFAQGKYRDEPEKLKEVTERLAANKQVRDQSETFLEKKISNLKEANEELERQIELERQAMTLQRTYEESRRSMESGYSRFEVGASEGARLTNRTDAALRDLQADVDNPLLGAGDSVSDMREYGAIVERMNQSREGLYSIEDRLNRALAERENLEISITEENRKQTEEASKRLALASREDQLRAAAAAAILRQRGGRQLSMQEFQFYSQDTRNAISNLMPQSVKGLDDTERDQNEARRKLDTEIAGLAVSLKMMKERFDELLPKAEKRAGELVDPSNLTGNKPRTAAEVIKGDKNEIRMNLNTGPISISLDLAPHLRSLETLLQTRFDEKLRSFAEEMRRYLTRDRDPNTTPAMEAW
jgi:TP901 family phage tail tape measure protein